MLDEAELLSRFAGKTALLGRLAKIFSEQTPRLIGDIRAAIGRGDANAVVFAAHTLKGSLAQIGAAGASDLARQLEEGAKGGLFSGMELLLKQLDEQADNIQRTLNELTKTA